MHPFEEVSFTEVHKSGGDFGLLLKLFLATLSPFPLSWTN